MVKILTGFSEKGGSTTAFINLTNYLNNNGVECEMYGPHDWHLDKCNAKKINEYVIDETDVLLLHFLNVKNKLNVKKTILVCHEKWWFDVSAVQPFVDEVVFLHEHHQKFHAKYTGKFSIIPNIKEKFIMRHKPELDKIAGVIGSIEDRKQTHVSVDRALADGCKRVYIIGHIGDINYYNNFIVDRLNDSKVTHIPYQTDKQSMYDQIGRVYHSSKGEVACLVKDECYFTGTQFFGNEETEHEVSLLSNEEILNLWKTVLKI